MPSMLKAFRVQCPAKMLHLNSTGTCLCPCSALKFLVLVDSCVMLFHMLFHMLFIVYCKIYSSLKRWNVLGKPSVSRLYARKPHLCCWPAEVHSVTDVVSKEPCSWFSEGLPLFCADGFGDTCNNPLTSCLIMFAVRRFCSYSCRLWPLQLSVCPLSAETFQATKAPVLGSFFVHDWIQPQLWKEGLQDVTPAQGWASSWGHPSRKWLVDRTVNTIIRSKQKQTWYIYFTGDRLT